MERNYSRMTEAERTTFIENNTEEDILFEAGEGTADWMDRVIEKANRSLFLKLKRNPLKIFKRSSRSLKRGIIILSKNGLLKVSWQIYGNSPGGSLRQGRINCRL